MSRAAWGRSSAADVLRWARAEGDGVVAVLGNHDVHLLARAAGVSERRRRDTLEDVLAAADGPELLAWLRARPLVHREGGFFLVHAGLLPAWSLDDAAALAREVEAVLRGPESARLLAEHDRVIERYTSSLPRWERVKLALAVLTRLRVAAPDGTIDLRFDGHPGDAPAGMQAWFDQRRPDRETIVHGHWARLGLRVAPGHIALDTGCVYGGALTAIRLEDRAVFQQPAIGE
jgi:bis(5'-nucleosyl)-tetraphosphatase (symmetrical)